jgi:phosphatidylinositol-3-phosphatase
MRIPPRIWALPFLFTVLIAATGCGGGSSVGASNNAQPAASQKTPTINFAAQPGTVASGAATVLSWSTSNANSVTISGVGTLPASGSKSVTPSATTTYTLTATGSGGTANSSTVVTVTTSGPAPTPGQTPAPTVTFSANPSSVAVGASAVLSWTTTNATSVSISGVGVFGANGSAKVTPSANTTYTATVQGAGGTAKASTSVAVTPIGMPSFQHVFLLMEENHSYSSVIGSSSMPYLNSLAQQYGLATQYFANTHPSIGNYFELTTGQIVTNDDAFSGTVSADNVVRHLLSAGKTWKSYAENLPAAGYTGGDVYPYAKRHNPFAYLTDVVNSQNQVNNLVPFSEFSSDLTNNQLPAYSFIIPNLLDDGHDGSLSQADSWLKTNIAPLIASSTFQNNGLLIIVFDESYDTDTQYGGGQVAAVVISPLAKKGYQSKTLYQHQSVCRLLLQGLGLNSFPGGCQSATQMSEFF